MQLPIKSLPRTEIITQNKYLRLADNLNNTHEKIKVYHEINKKNNKGIHYVKWILTKGLKYQNTKKTLKWSIGVSNKLYTNESGSGISEEKYREVYTKTKEITKNKKLFFEKLYPKLNYKNKKKNKVDRFITKYLKESGNKNRKNIALFKTALEAMDKEKWFAVFNTLTVDDEHYNKIFYENGDQFNRYIKAVGNNAKSRESSVRRCDKEVHSHIATVETGEKTGRLHIHVMHFLKRLPTGSETDPNKGREIPCLKEINGFKRYWKYGYSSPIAIRTSNNDAYGKLGWRWRSDKNNVAEKNSNIETVAYYICKYINKADKKHKFRMRVSRNFGMNLIKTILKEEPEWKIKKLNRLNSQALRINKKWIPKQIVRRETSKILLKKMTKRKMLRVLNSKKQETIYRKMQQSIGTIQESVSQKSNENQYGMKSISNLVESEIEKINLKIEKKNLQVFNGFTKMVKGS